eukprot:2919251-Pyramimonas_sp.AAC.1
MLSRLRSLGHKAFEKRLACGGQDRGVLRCTLCRFDPWENENVASIAYRLERAEANTSAHSREHRSTLSQLAGREAVC